MKKPLYIQQFEQACPLLKYLLKEKPDNAMGLWSLLYWEFWNTLEHEPRKTKQILKFCRFSASTKAHAILREGVEYAFGEHLLDYPEQFPVLARFLKIDDLDSFTECLICWNGKQKYTRRRNKLERMIKAEQRN